MKPATITQRRIVYFMGFDPRGSSFYYQLLKREANRSKRRGITAMSVSPLNNGELFSQCQWQQAQGIDGDYRFAEMDDLIRANFRPFLGACWWWWLQLSCMLLPDFALWQPRGQSRFFYAFLLYPLVMPALVVALAVWLSLMASTALSSILGAGFWGWCLFPIITLLADVIFRRFDHIFYIRYLLGDFLFTHAILSGRNAAMEQRIALWAQQLAADVKALPADTELLLVGHSSGGIIAGRVAQMLQQQLDDRGRGKWCLLTLGNQASTGLARFAAPYHRAVANLTHSQPCPWLDIFAPQDVISSGRFDAGVLPGAVPGTIRMQSALFRESMPPADYQRLRFRFFSMHLQYLRANVSGLGFDYFQLMTSPYPTAQYQPRRAT